MVASTSEPTGWRSTNSRNGSSSLIGACLEPAGASAFLAGAARSRAGPRPAAAAPPRRGLLRPADRAWSGGGVLGTGIGCDAALLGRPAAAFLASARPFLAVPRGPPADGPAHRRPGHEHPADVGHGLAADEAAVVEQPRELAVELLERVVRQDRRLGLVGDGEHEGVAAADGAGRRATPARCSRRRRRTPAPRAESMRWPNVASTTTVMTSCGVLLEEGHDGLVELAQAGHGPPLGGDVRAVDDDVSGHNGCQSTIQRRAEVRYGADFSALRSAAVIRAVLWDFGGVILTSPFEAFAALRARARPARGLHPPGERHQPRTPTPGPASSAASIDRRGVRRRVRAGGAERSAATLSGRPGPRAAGRRHPPRDGRRRCDGCGRRLPRRPASPTTSPTAAPATTGPRCAR